MPPTVVAKVINADGSESSFGPMEVEQETADLITGHLALPEEQRRAAILTAQMEEAQREVVARNEAAEAENQRRRELADQGIDPDAPDAEPAPEPTPEPTPEPAPVETPQEG